MTEQNIYNTININELNGTTSDDTLIGGNSNDSIEGDRGDDFLAGAAGNDVISGGFGNDEIIGGVGSDTITGNSESDLFTYAEDPFAGQDVSSPERQIIQNEDFITDFNFAEDKYRFSTNDFDVSGDVKFTAVDANAEGASIAPGTNVVSLLNSNNAETPDAPFLAGAAVNQIAELTSEDGAGFFVYFNSNLEQNRVVYSTNLNDADADLKVISRQTDLIGQEAIAALGDFSASNFRFEDIQLDDLDRGNEAILGDADDNELIGTAGEDLLFGDLGGDTITGGAGADVFAYVGNPFEENVSSPERQIIQNEDFITDFNFAEDKYRFNPTNFDLTGEVNFAGVDANAPDPLIAPGTNVVALLNTNNADAVDKPFLAGSAASQIADLVTEDGAGFFIYFNSNLEQNRLGYSTNLNDANADIKVISRQTDLTGADAIAALDDFSADNFEFETI